MTVPHRLDPLFNFASVALVGASETSGMGVRPYQNLQRLEYDGVFYPVNPRRDTVHGMTCYPSVSACPTVPEMAIVAIPAEGVPGVIEECAEIGVKAAVILAAGFVDLDEHGAELQARITAAARRSGLLVVGPNCLGLFSVVNRCAASSTSPPTLAGNVALVSHSGGLLNEIVSSSLPRGVGFSHAVSAGNEAGVTAADLIDYYVADPSTEVILAILETARDPGGFVEAATRALEARKPIVALKMGWSEKGRRSAFTHTGANTGNDEVYSALFRQKGIIRVNDIDELVDMGALLAMSMDKLRNRRMERAAIIEISGGGKGHSSDTSAAAGVPLPDPSDATLATFEALPDDTYPTNPIDTGGSWGDADKAEVYPLTLDAFASQPDIDVIISRYTIPRTGDLGVLNQRLAEWEAARAAHPDRLFPVLSRTCDQYSEEWERAVRERRIPFVRGYGRGMRSIGLMAEYSRAIHGSAPERGRAERVRPAPQASDESARIMEAGQTHELLASLGVTVQPAREPGVEIALGAFRDVQFGPVVTFALGGAVGEVLADRAMRLAPVSPDDALAMLSEIEGARLLDGGPNLPAANRDAIRDALCQLSELLAKRPDIARIAVEPAVASAKGITAAAARVELAPD
jgi:acyl-CoA synthetase (NDP forming)